MEKESIDLLMVLLESVERVELNGNLLRKAQNLKPAVEQAKKVLEQEAKGK
jgi:hypothetical protein